MSAPPNADCLSTQGLRKLRQSQASTHRQSTPKKDFGAYGRDLEDAFIKIFGTR